MKKINLAFTLAEVLITLGIIGIVAAMTIPTLMKNIQDSQYKQAWKKEFSAMTQVSQRVFSDNGGNIKDLCTNGDHDCFKNFFKPYLNYTKECNNGDTIGKCWHNNGGSEKQLNGVSNPDELNTSGLILNDGTLVYFRILSGGCTFSLTSTITDRCGNVNVDINGFTPPNVIGRDIFVIYITSNNIYPGGITGDGGDCSTSGKGWGCGAQYLYNN